MKTKQAKTVRETGAAVAETLGLYHAWLAVLLRRLGEAEVRVGETELREALGKLSCQVGRDDGMYVIRMTVDGARADDEGRGGEQRLGGQEEAIACDGEQND